MSPLKRLSSSPSSPHASPSKFCRPNPPVVPTPSTPYDQLLHALHSFHQTHPSSVSSRPSLVVYWMRMRDLRISDNRALSLASDCAHRISPPAPLIVLHVLSPSDYLAHHRSPRRIDFVLRNLALLQKKLQNLHIPLYCLTVPQRRSVPQTVIDLLSHWKATHLFANIEHEVDELRRDIKVINLASDNSNTLPLALDFMHDTCVIEPGRVRTKEDKPYAVFGPWQKNWTNIINQNLADHVDAAKDPQPNSPSIHQDPKLKELFEVVVPSEVKGFELSAEDGQVMRSTWQEGEEFAHQVLAEFINPPLNLSNSSKSKLNITKPNQPKSVPTILPTSKPLTTTKTAAPIDNYSTHRNRPDIPGTSSRLSAYLAAGVISVRACLRASLEKSKKNRLETDKRELGVGMWQSELAWRDFYQHVMAAWPRVSMNQCFNLKYQNTMVWETDPSLLQAWKMGKTGFPFIDASMRQLLQTGYMHNRGRMCVAMFLTKDLMMDWRLGERWFMQNLVDGDLGSNNGGWQWSSSTGTDPQPYFRIFAPLAQSLKSDPEGHFIRTYVPELRALSSKVIHEPINHLSPTEFTKLGYPKPIVDHSVVRKRALARYKNPGSAANE